MEPRREPPFRMTDQELKRLTNFVAILIKIDRRLKKAKGAKKKRKSSYTNTARGHLRPRATSALLPTTEVISAALRQLLLIPHVLPFI